MKLPFTGPYWRNLGETWLHTTTREGKVLGAAIVVSASISSASLDIPVFHLLCILSAFAVVVYGVARLRRPRLRLRGGVPEKAVSGEVLMVAHTVVNNGKQTAYDVSAGFLQLPDEVESTGVEELAPVLEPGGSTVVTSMLRPQRRGLYALPEPRAYSTFPFHIYRVRAPRDRRKPESTPLLVYPRFHPLLGIDVPVSARYQPGGIALSSNVGESPEYIGNRPYRSGDSRRHLDFRAWARLAQPVVREYQEEYYCRVALVLDTFIPGKKQPPPAGFPTLEAAVSLTAAVADAMARGEYIIDLFAAGPTLHVFRAGRHTAHFENVLEILACVDACRTNPFDVVTPAITDELANISTVICVLLDWDASREALVRAAVDCGCSTKVIVLRDGEPTEPFDQLAEECRITQLAPGDVLNGRVEAL
ncbi:MAG: hypothetical protein AMXMBFR82_08440 [Candidatus Hydrogenedentota bacterium]